PYPEQALRPLPKLLVSFNSSPSVKWQQVLPIAMVTIQFRCVKTF
ncbi:MAG: hypothetical protein ACJAZF_004982, partial [Granulosicoccus sp.]